MPHTARPSHGGYGKRIGIELDFSQNINPLGMPESVRQAVIASAKDWEGYPDPECVRLRGLLAGHFGTDPANIVCGNGADDLIYRIVQAVRPGKALVCVPTFGEYEKALRQSGARVEYYQLRPEHGFDAREDILESISPDMDMVFFCNPNNPTGRLCGRDFMEKLADKALGCGALLICDECFMELAGRGKEAASTMSLTAGHFENVIVLRAFTKTYAMPGLRLGYALFRDPVLAGRVADTGQYWSVSAPAEAAGAAALEERGYVERSAELIASERTYLENELRLMGIGYVESSANFILIYNRKLPLYLRMLESGILIRDCSDFRELGQGWYRIAVRKHWENVRLAEALKNALYC